MLWRLLTFNIATSASAPAPKKRGRPARATEADEEAVEPSKKRGRPASTAAAPKKPARPAKATVSASAPPKKRGRPAKSINNAPEPEPAEAEDELVLEPPKKRGRPAKAANTAAEPEVVEENSPEPVKERGRPSKQSAPAQKATAAMQQSGRKRGRPSTVQTETEPEEAPAALETPARRKRGRGPNGGETTKIAADATNAAEQLEEALVNVAEESADIEGEVPGRTEGKNYWLMKAEQLDRIETLQSGREFNTKFTIDDLKNANAPEPWEGVRNMVARNNMRAMKKGDMGFFYASQGKGKLQPGITGILEVVKEHEPDFTVTDPDSVGFVQPAKRAKENQWSLVHVEYRKKLKTPVTLKELQKFARGNGILKDMQVIKQSRLSVTKVSEKEWNFIVNELIDGYEEGEEDDRVEGEGLEDKDDDDDGADGLKVRNGPPRDGSPSLNGGAQAVAGALEDLLELQLPQDNSVPVSSALTTGGVGELPTSGSVLPPTTHATSRPTSRSASRPGSSHNGLAPTLAAPVIETVEAVSDAVKSSVDRIAQDLAPGFARPTSRAGSSRAASRSSSRAPGLRAPSLKSSLEPSIRPGSRGRSKTPQPSLMASLLEE